MSRSESSTFDYVIALFAASDALTHETCLEAVIEAAENLRQVSPEQGMLPALDAKIARMQIIKRLASPRTWCEFHNDAPAVNPASVYSAASQGFPGDQAPHRG